MIQASIQLNSIQVNSNLKDQGPKTRQPKFESSNVELSISHPNNNLAGDKSIETLPTPIDVKNTLDMSKEHQMIDKTPNTATRKDKISLKLKLNNMRNVNLQHKSLQNSSSESTQIQKVRSDNINQSNFLKKVGESVFVSKEF